MPTSSPPMQLPPESLRKARLRELQAHSPPLVSSLVATRNLSAGTPSREVQPPPLQSAFVSRTGREFISHGREQGRPPPRSASARAARVAKPVCAQYLPQHGGAVYRAFGEKSYYYRPPPPEKEFMFTQRKQTLPKYFVKTAPSSIRDGHRFSSVLPTPRLAMDPRVLRGPKSPTAPWLLRDGRGCGPVFECM